MPKLEIHPFSEEFRGDAAALLADRHARHRAAEPLLAEVDDMAAQIPDGDGAVATRGGTVVAYVVAAVSDERAEVGFAGCAASEPEAVRDVYAHLARSWPRQHQALIPASDGTLIEPWFRLAFGCQWMAAVRDATPVGLRRELDWLAVALRLHVPERVRGVVEDDVQLAFLDALVEPGATEHEPAQPVDERAVGGADELRPAVVDVLAEAGGGVDDLAVDREVDEVFELLVTEAPADEAELQRGVLAALREVVLVEGEAELTVFEDVVLS